MKNILIAVTGLTPQVVTEALFCLVVKKKTPVDEVFILTTGRGRDVALGKDKAPNTPKSPLATEIEHMCKHWKLTPPKFGLKNIIVASEESLEVNDIRNDNDNMLFPDKAAELLQTLSRKIDNRLFCLISGGRKSMGVHLASSLQLFGRAGDQLLHVLTSEINEFKGFYPKNKMESAELELSEIPFVPLRQILFRENQPEQMSTSFRSLVDTTRKELEILSDTTVVVADIEAKQLRSGERYVQLETLELALYIKIYQLSSEEKKKAGFLSEKEFSDRVASFYKEHFNKDLEPYDKNSRTKKWNHKGFDKESIAQKRSKINKKVKSLFTDDKTAGLFLITSQGGYGNTSYYIPTSDKIRIKK